MAQGRENTTWISIGPAKIPLEVKSKKEAEVYHEAEMLADKIWRQHEARFSAKFTPTEMMAMVAFWMACKYQASMERNGKVNDFLKEFEKKLDDIVVREKR